VLATAAAAAAAAAGFVSSTVQAHAAACLLLQLLALPEYRRYGSSYYCFYHVSNSRLCICCLCRHADAICCSSLQRCCWQPYCCLQCGTAVGWLLSNQHLQQGNVSAALRDEVVCWQA
jgi:hypothetical protein